MGREDSFDLKPGDILANKFRIERVLGIGGMGLVAAAWHLELRARVALKVLRPGAALDDQAVERLSREASAVARMRSEYVVRVFDVGRLPEGGPPYIVMEHLEGEDLATRLAARGPMPVDEAVGYILHACEGLAEAHSLGIVHRDLKPANLFLTKRPDGQKIVKLVDFGLAKTLNATGARLTGPLVAMGSPLYMSPEQARATHDVHATTDIWSLGVCLYEMLTGIPPFDAASVADIIAMVLTKAPKGPSELRPELPARLAEAVMRCLRKSPLERFADVAALAEAIEEFAPASQRRVSAGIRRVLTSGAAPHREEALPPRTSGAVHARATSAKRRTFWTRVAMVGATIVGLVAIAAPWRWTTSRPAAPQAVTSAAASAEPSAQTVPSDEVAALAIQSVQGRPIATPAPQSRAPRRASHPRNKPGRGTGRVVPDEPAPEPESPPEPQPEPPVTASVAAAPTAAPTPPPPPRFDVASARVEIGSATNTSGTTAANVNRTIAALGGRITACYRTALPQMPEPLEGAGTLHIETDEEGVITASRVLGGLATASACIAATASGRKIPNVDTGRARADIPLVFRAR